MGLDETDGAHTQHSPEGKIRLFRRRANRSIEHN